MGPELSGRAGGARGAARLKSRCSRRPPLLTTASRVVSVAEAVTMVTSFGCASESAAMAGIAWLADAELRLRLTARPASMAERRRVLLPSCRGRHRHPLRRLRKRQQERKPRRAARERARSSMYTI